MRRRFPRQPLDCTARRASALQLWRLCRASTGLCDVFNPKLRPAVQTLAKRLLISTPTQAAFRYQRTSSRYRYYPSHPIRMLRMAPSTDAGGEHFLSENREHDFGMGPLSHRIDTPEDAPARCYIVWLGMRTPLHTSAWDVNSGNAENRNTTATPYRHCPC